jgi:cytochrome d ubiquinol oxidase subunit I
MLRGRRDRHHRLGLLIPLTIALIATPVQIFFGDVAARSVADHQPAKFAAFECIQETGPDQTEYLGGICTDDGVKGAIGIPGLDSWLVGFNTDTVVTGLNDIPADERPPANTLLHLSFDAMVGIGFALLALGGWTAFVWWRRRDIPRSDWFLRAVAVSGVAAIVALWAGWIVTEVGRQPWIVQGFMRTEEAVTEAKGIWFAFAGVLVLYAALGTTAILVLRGMSRRWRERGEGEELATPYAPPAEREEVGR